MNRSTLRRLNRTLGVIACVILVSGVSASTGVAQTVTHQRITGNIWRIDGAVDVIIVQTGPDGLLMIDTGYPFAEAGVRSTLKQIAGTDRVARLVNTHAHHAFSNHLYAGAAEIIAHRNAAMRLKGGYMMAGQVVDALPTAALPKRTFGDSLRIRMNGEDITLLYVPGAHTDSDVAVIFNQSRVVATGDAYVPHMPWISVDEGADVGQLLDGLDLLLRRIPDDAVIIPGHDRVTLTKDSLRAFRAMIAEAADTISARMSAGMSLRMIQTLGLPSLARWQGQGVPEWLFIESIYRSFTRARANFGAIATRFDNGRWWNGSEFVNATLYSVNGILTLDPPARVDSVVDFKGGWVIPPFADAHTHAFGDTAQLSEDIAKFTRAGVLYAMVQDPAGRISVPKARLTAQPENPEVAYTQGVVTPSWGVISDMYGMLAGMGKYGPGVTIEQLDGDVVFRIDNVEQLRAAWPAIKSRNQRFIKVIVAFATELEQRLASPGTYKANPPQYSAKPGVTSSVLNELVRLAHTDGLSVSAHIETREDFRLVVEAGVDWIAHLPASWQIGEGTGYRLDQTTPWLLTREDARAARMAGTKVITTLGSRAPGDDREQYFRSIHQANLKTIADAGVTIAIGSDRFRGTVVDELMYLSSLGVHSNSQLLNLATSQTARLIFPELKIGHLRAGYEADFLVLDENPLENFANVQKIRLRVKRGVPLSP